jgi:hypothetical protein
VDRLGSFAQSVLNNLGPSLAVLLVIASGAVAGGVYQWTDDKGAVHFTDDPGKIPKKFHHTVLELSPPDPPEKDQPPKGVSEEEEIESEATPEASPKREPAPESSLVAPSEPVDFNGHNREWWRQRVQEWQAKKTDAQAKLADAQERLGQERFLNATTGNMKRIQDISAEVSKYEADLKEAEHMLSEGLSDEARRAQAPPGWLRD